MNQHTDVAAVIVTRGDVPDNIEQIRESPIFDEVIVWDNSVQPNLKCFGRYVAMLRTDKPVIYFQDDDCIVPVEAQNALVEQYEPGTILSNMDDHWGFGHPLWLLPSGGLLTDRELPARAFARWLAAGQSVETLLEAPDIIFAVLTPGRRLDFGKADMPAAYAEQVIHRQPGFMERRQWFYDTAKEIRGTDEALEDLVAHVSRLALDRASAARA